MAVTHPFTVSLVLSEIQLATIITALHDYYSSTESPCPDASMKLYGYLVDNYRNAVLDHAQDLLYVGDG